jgi:hypothetical protein
VKYSSSKLQACDAVRNDRMYGNSGLRTGYLDSAGSCCFQVELGVSEFAIWFGSNMLYGPSPGSAELFIFGSRAISALLATSNV